MLLGEPDERRNALLAVLALRGHRAHVRPVHHLGYLDHGQGLKVVRGHDPREVFEPRLVRQLDGRRGVADLGNL